LCNFAQNGHSKSEYSIHVILASIFHLIYELSFIAFNFSVSNIINHFSLLSKKGLNLAQIAKVNLPVFNGSKNVFTFGTTSQF
jgi:hypothetical protein